MKPITELPPEAKYELDLERLRDACRAEEFTYESEVQLSWRTLPVGELPVKAEVLGRPAGEFKMHPATFVTCACAFFGGLIGGLLCIDQSFPLQWYAAIPLGAIGGALVGIVIYMTGIKTMRDVTIDYRNQQIQWKIKEKRDSCDFHEVERVILRGIRWEESHKDSNDQSIKIASFRNRLEIAIGEQRVVLLETDEWRNSAGAAMNDLAGLGGSLSKTLDVPCEWIDFLSWGRGMRGKITAARVFQAWYIIPFIIAFMVIVTVLSRI